MLNWIRNKILDWLEEGALERYDDEVVIRGALFKKQEIKRIESEWVRDGLIR